jgi:aminoglycoside phosphotransferase (APT) family kinase protein
LFEDQFDESAADERDHDSADEREQWLRENRPPHHS